MDLEENRRTKWIRTLIDELESMLLAYVAALLKSYDLAQDVVQEAFISLCQQPREKVEGHERPWLFRVCRNRAIDILRKEKPMQNLDDDFEPAATTASPGHEAETNELNAMVLSRIASLPNAQREVVRLKFQSGLSYREIAEVTGRKVGNVGALLHVALKQLRHDLQTTEALS